MCEHPLVFAGFLPRLYSKSKSRNLPHMSVRALAGVMALMAGVAAHAAEPTAGAHAHHEAPAPATPHGVVPVPVEGQPLAANVQRLMNALEHLGVPLAEEKRLALMAAGRARDARQLQELLDAHVLIVVHINPETRVKVSRGPAPARLQQAGYTPVLVKVVNESGGTQALRIGSPQAGPVYAGMSKLSGERMQQPHLRVNENTERRTDRFLEAEMFTAPPMASNLSGLEVEYAIALLYAHEAGRREATLTCDVGQGTQDLGFRGEVPVLFDVRPAVTATLRVQDHDGKPTMGRFQFADRHGHVFPPQAKRLAPDLFFQKHIYRADGETVLLPPGKFTMHYGRGPEYRWIEREITIPEPRGTDSLAVNHAHHGREARPNPGAEIAVTLERWVNPAAHGYFSGDHHVHASGCAHYTSPTEGIEPVEMFRQLKGEALNVASVLTWGPGFDYQQQFSRARWTGRASR